MTKASWHGTFGYRPEVPPCTHANQATLREATG